MFRFCAFVSKCVRRSPISVPIYNNGSTFLKWFGTKYPNYYGCHKFCYPITTKSQNLNVSDFSVLTFAFIVAHCSSKEDGHKRKSMVYPHFIYNFCIIKKNMMVIIGIINVWDFR